MSDALQFVTLHVSTMHSVYMARHVDKYIPNTILIPACILPELCQVIHIATYCVQELTVVVVVDGEGCVMVQVSHCLICSFLQALQWGQGSLQYSQIFHKRTEKTTSVKPLQ